MTRPDIIVGQISRIDPPLAIQAVPEDGRTVHFSDGRIAHLDPGNPHSISFGEILDDMRQADIPVYVELDQKRGTIKQLRIPLVVAVSEITRTDSGQLLVELEISSARHTLSPGNPNFDSLQTSLEDARQHHVLVIVTETEDHEIIDVRPGSLR
ncbi:MAG: hypothetical protein WCS87_05055 [Methylococcaceae bacterium]